MRTVVSACLLVLGCAPETKSTPAGAEPDLSQACDPAQDADADGLDACTEAELGTDDTAPDTDGDGLSDAEEVDCISDPTDPDERCYACGWPHNDPGDLTDVGTEVGSTIDNIELIDQCGERVQLWDLSGEWHLLFMTASWCLSCLDEAREFDAEQAAFVARTGLDFSILTVVFQDSAGRLPAPDEGTRYAEAADIENQPVFVDPIAAVLSATPHDGLLLPGVCALSPQMVLVECADGVGAVDDMLAVVASAAP